MYQQGSTAGICVYDDGTFALFGYATLVWGKYTIENEKISFIPNVPKQAFSVLGRENKSISNGMIITVGSEFRRSGPIQIQFDSAKVLNLFDENFPKGASHYTTKTIDKAKTLTLSQNSENTSLENNTNTFQLPAQCNEFILFMYRTSSEQRPFEGSFATEDGKQVLQSRWGQFEKQPQGKDPEWETYLAESKVAGEKMKNTATFYFNDQFKSATGSNYLTEKQSTFDVRNYVLDKGSNKLIHKEIYKKGKDYSKAVAEDYHDERYMLSYQEIPIAKATKTESGKVQVAPRALFINAQ